MVMKFITYLLYIISCFIISAQAFGLDVASKPVSLQSASNTLKVTADKIDYDEETRIVILTGHVRVTYGGRVFESEYARFDSSTNMLITDRDYTISENGKPLINGKAIAYNVTQSTLSQLDNYVAIVNEDNVVFIKAKKVENIDGKQVFHDADASLCNRADKDYHIYSSKVTYDPTGKNMTMENATIYMGSVPIFYWPSITSKLKDKKKKKKNKELFPQITSTPQRGTAFKVELADVLDLMGYESPEGNITFSPYVVSYSKIGWGGGANIYYEMSERDYMEGMIDYKNDVGLGGGVIYTHGIGPSEGYSIYMDKRDVRNGVSLDNYFTYYSITELPNIIYNNSYSIGSFIGMPARLSYGLGYAAFTESLIGSASGAVSSVADNRFSSSIGVGFSHPIYKDDVQELSYGLGIGEGYSSYSRSGNTQSVANMTNTINYSLYFLSTSTSLINFNQAGFSPFAFDRRGVGDRYLSTSGKVALGSDFYIPLGYGRNLDANTDTLIMYGLYYETDCLKFGFRTNTISGEYWIDLLIKGL